MDDHNRPSDDTPEPDELSGILREAVESICRQEPPADVLAGVLGRARQIPATTAAKGTVPFSASLETTDENRDRPQRIPKPQPSTREPFMLCLANRGVVAVGAALSLLIAWVLSSLTPHQSPTSLAQALQKTVAAQTLQLKLTRDGQTSEAWIRQGRQLRWNRPDGTCQIARDNRLWTIDPRQNRATSQTSPFFQNSQPGADLLVLMNVPLEKGLLQAEPVRRVTHDGGPCDVYQWTGAENAEKEGPLCVEALVQADSRTLASLEIFRERDGQRKPLGQLAVVARDRPVADEMFVVGDTLTEDGRIGKVTDLQGIVSLRPAGADRWTPLAEHMLLRPGDWLRTDLRGANAVSLRLVKDTQVILGPGTLVELVGPKQLRISEGELKVVAVEKAPVELLGPDGKSVQMAGKQLYRVEGPKLVRLDKEPLWLRRYEGKTANQSLGSLVAKVDGRDVPLSVGYHKVTVDIRDQIARTTIEETFVNHTKGTLEGVFYFPLPQDASIAGFGMWIGDRLVEADVVEKQRAREIYETILRERRDPGLLEWTGGNIFKARVFPIFGESEKRITLTYTQVLPLRGNSYRYQYALQSEMLKQHPLRQLEIDVKINSALRLKSVNSPTHPTRNSLTEHAARVEFSAQEYVPQQDFEVVVEIDGRQADLVMIPHRRGDDGYFMVQLTPPCGAGVSPVPQGMLQRELLPNGQPMELLIVADTSASMDAPSRAQQAALVAALLGALGPKDQINLATCDVTCSWAFEKSRPADTKNVAALRVFLDNRISLGWTDLDAAMRSALDRCGPHTQVVYIGDGISTAPTGEDAASARFHPERHESGPPLPPGEGRGEGSPPRTLAIGNGPSTAPSPPAPLPKGEGRVYGRSPGNDPLDNDPAAFAASLRRMAAGRPGTFHAVAVSSSFEPLVMKAIASVGGGSFRQVAGSNSPSAVAAQLLGEMTQPALRDLKVEFRGLRTARVYPEELPNLELGSQQIILGRYLPDDRDHAGEVIVTGTQAGKPVRFTAAVTLKDAEQGNSFIPRLWARLHLDSLLQQGSSAAIRDEIIALSEEHHLITPYTSLLVLESDADRERFGVRRRFQMRDGEKFFAQGRDNANWELVQQQMKRAGTWRVGLRRDVLRQLGALGRQTPGTPYIPGACSYVRHGDRGFAMGGMGGDPGGVVTNGGALNYFGVQDSEGAGGSFAVATPQLGGYDATQQEPPTGRVMLGVGVNSDAGLVGNNVLDEQGASDSWDADGPVAAPAACAPASLSITAGEKASPEGHAERGEAEDEKSELGRLSQEESVDGDSQVIEYLAAGQSPVGGHTKGFVGLATSTLDRSRAVEGMPAFCVVPTPGRRSSVNDPTSSAKIFSFFVGFDDHRDYGVASAGWSQPTEAWLDELFPALPPPPAKEKEPEPRWPAEARALAERLVRSEQLAAVNGGLQIDIQSQTFDPRWNELSGQEQTSAAIAPIGWLVTRRGDRQQTSVAWCDAHQRGVISKAFELGRVRKSTLADVARPPVDLGLGTMTRLDRAYAGYAIALRPQADRRTLLVLTRPDNERDEVHILVDTARMVVLRLETRQMGKVTSTTTLGDFIQLGGAWWAGRIETDDADGHRTALVAQKFTDLAPGRFTQLEKDGIADRQHVLLLEQPLPSLIEAKRAAAAGKARFEDQIVLMLHFQATQQWQRVLDELGKAEKLVADKPGRRWIRSLVLTAARRHDEVKQRYFDEAATLVKGLGPQATPDEAYLADFMVDRGSSLFEANEMLALLGVLKVVYDRQPTYLEAPITWQQRRINYLEHAGQSPEALRLRKQLAEQYPRDAELQRLYAQGLVQAGQYADAYAWIDRVLTSDIHWLPAEEQSLRSAYADWLRAQGRYADLLEYLAAWVRRNPPDATAYQQYLSALVWNDRPKEAERLMARWIEEGKRPDTLPPEVASRLQAAVSHALGQGCNFYVDRIDPEWLKTLARAEIFFARHPSQGGIADQIMGNSAFQQSDPCRDVRRQALKILHDDLSKLTPVEIARLVSWINAGDPAIEAPEWQRLAAGLRERWTNEAKPELQQQLGQTLVTVLSGHADATALLRFLQQQYEHGLEEHRAAYASQWFDTLLRQPWSAAHEDAAFALLEKLSDAEEPAVRLAAAVAGLHRLTDRMVQARFQAAIGKVEHQEKLTRTELRVKREENLQAARHGFIERLRQAAKQSSRGLSRVSSVVSERDAETGTVPFTRWLSVERLYLQVLVGKQLDKVAEECFELLGPPTAGKKDANSPDGDVAQRLEEMLHHRYLVTLMNLAARKTAKPELAPRVLAYLEQTAAAEPQEPRWKLMQYQLLVALDRPRDLQKKLQGWIGEGTVPSFVRRLGTRRRNWDCPPPAIDPNTWRLSLAYLLAEQGRIAEAIALFEAIAAADELSAADYRTLADWYLVVGRRPEHERAMIAALKATDQWRLYRWLYAELQPWQRTDAPPPRELDPQVPLAFAALLEKADQQQDYLGLLRQFYQTTRDFRLLAGLADAVVGHTAGHVYQMLQGMGPVLAEIRDEATADSLVEQLAQVRRRTKTDVDRRALDLLEMLVERRAADLQNQPGPHVARALAALERSWKRQWTAGEPRWMADLLASLGHISQPELAQEQLRELTSLHRDAATGSIDRLHIAHALARAQWSYDRQQEAIDLLSSALDEYEAACGGTLPVEANEPFSTMISYLEQRRNYARGEDRLFAQLKHPANPQQRDWLGEQLYQLYQSAIAGDGEVLLGVGAALYEAVQQKLFDELKTADDNHRSNLLSRLLTIYRTAHGKKLPGPVDVVADLRRFAFHRLPEVLTRQNNNYDNLVSQTGQTLHDLVGPRDGLAFLIQQIEATPTWLCYNGQDGWSRFAWTLGEWRPEAKDLGDLEPRLLRIVLAELREDLRSRQSRHRVIYDRRYGYWWAEKENDFARVADEVLAKDRQSAAATVYIAEYLYWGLNRYGRAIDVLLDAHRRELLDEAGQATLVDYLQRQSRFAESIAVLEPLVQRRPDNLDYRVQLMRAYFHVNRQADLLALLKKTDGYFHQPGRWQEPVMRALAASCLENHLFAQSVAYYREVISLHQRTAPRRGIGDGALANYYGGLARAYGGLKQTGDAVDAACGAVVSWGPRQQNRVEALDSLRQVLRQAPDLDAYVAQLDRQTAASGQDNPIVRKAIGQIYLEKQQYPRAITQLSTAAALQPNDAETHRALLDCFDRQHDQPGAIEQLLRNRELAGRDMNLYEDLGRRFETLGRSDQADRAYTSIVEMLPSEAESHRRLAEIRQRQNRWEDAIAQWQQVARLGELEPTGLLGLTTALLHQNHHEAAAAALAKLKGRTWPPRFADAEEKFRRLQQQIESKAAMP